MTSEERLELRNILKPALESLGFAHETTWILDYIQRKNLANHTDNHNEIKRIVKLKEEGHPLAHIFGSWNFRGHELYVNKNTLIPRPETEELVEAMIMAVENSLLSSNKIFERGFRMADLGAGSGCIGLIFFADLLADVQTEKGNAAEVSKNFELFLVEQSSEACEVIRQNVDLLRPKLYGAKVEVIHSDWNQFSEKSLDLIASNPPYITPEEFKDLDASVKDFEPQSALLCKDRLHTYKEIIEIARNALVDRGWLFMELGVAQGEAVQEFLSGDSAFNDIRTLRDMAKKPRIFCARRVVES